MNIELENINFLLNKIIQYFFGIKESFAISLNTDECDDKPIVFRQLTTNVTDSRINRDAGIQRYVTIDWLVFCANKTCSNQLIARVLFKGLVDKITDLIQLEELNNRLRNFVLMDSVEEHDILKLNEDAVISHFWSKLLDKKWLIDYYIDLALASNGLPDSELILQLSAMRYEKREVSTKLYFVDDVNLKCELSFSDEMRGSNVLDFSRENLRTIRKLMELSGEQYGLIIHNKTVLGVVNIEDNNHPDCYIDIKGYLKWSLNYGKEVVFEYSNGLYRIGVISSEEAYCYKKEQLKVFLSKWELGNKIDRILENIDVIKDAATHGSSIVFIDKGMLADKLDKLVQLNRGYKVDEIDLSSAAKITGLTSVDGAIMTDLDCKCMGIGVILDGEALQKGNNGRGARYNSVTNYIRVIREENQDVCCFAAIFSEDGMVNFACGTFGKKCVEVF